MMKKLIFLLATVGICPTIAQPLVLQPSVSPDGQFIAFSFQGDIWKASINGGRADRLTIHEGYEGNPVWSPDGNRIGFTSDRFGNNDVFTIPSNGGTPSRLTHHSASDQIYSFTPDGKVLFTTNRNYKQVERENEIYQVANDGSTPFRFMDAMGFDPVASPDGSKIAFVRGTCRTSREDYRGPANRQIWIWNIEDDEYTQLTTFEGNEFNPQWQDDNTLLFISPKSGKYNVHQITLDGVESQLTTETEFGVNSFGYGNGIIVYQFGDQVVSFEVESGTRNTIEIDVSSDYRFDPVVSKTISNDVDEFAVSPNGKLTAYIVRGEIFITRNDKEDKSSVRITNNTFRERDVTWLNDEVLIFVSDMHGQNDLFSARSNSSETNLFYSLKYSINRITSTAEEEFGPIVSPDGKKIAYRQGRGKLLTANISENGSLSNIITLQDGWDYPGGVSWSPDSKWLAYSLSDLNFNEEVYIHAADNSMTPVNVSMHPKYDGRPFWSPDGSKLGFVSGRNNGDTDIWFAWLKTEDWQKSKGQWKRLEIQAEDKGDEDEDEDFRIDFDGIYQRLTQVTSFSGNESEFVFDQKGEFVYYSLGSAGRQDYEVKRNLFKIKWDGSSLEEIIGGNKRPNQLQLAEDGDYLYVNSTGGKIIRVKTKDDKDETLNISSTTTIDYPGEREQIFEEGWRALNAGFYDPNFHGNDWNALKEKYKPICLKASTKEDFKYIYNLMLGQLNASHMGMYRGENQKKTQTQKTGLIGVEGRNVSNGFQIEAILPGSPASREESQLMVGDIITSVNQQVVSPTTNFFSLLTDQIDQPVLFQVTRAGKDTELIIWPVSSLSTEKYDDWVETRRKLTNQYSNGRLGYLHIRGMNWSSFERFERELTAAGYGKEGIVIDVRYNGGGWTTDYLMAVLNVRQHAYTIPRGAASNLQEEHLKFKETYPFGERLPLASWTKPSIAMCNENSYSNAEIFSHAYKTLDIGTLVGKPTFGAVISTGGWTLVDGSYVRMPFRAWYVKATEENMELGPAVPDIIVDNKPAYRAKNEDLQLKKAVETLIGKLEE